MCMSPRDISTGDGFTNGLSDEDRDYLKMVVVNAAVDAYRAGIRECIAVVEEEMQHNGWDQTTINCTTQPMRALLEDKP